MDRPRSFRPPCRLSHRSPLKACSPDGSRPMVHKSAVVQGLLPKHQRGWQWAQLLGQRAVLRRGRERQPWRQKKRGAPPSAAAMWRAPSPPILLLVGDRCCPGALWQGAACGNAAGCSAVRRSGSPRGRRNRSPAWRQRSAEDARLDEASLHALAAYGFGRSASAAVRVKRPVPAPRCA